MPGKRPKIAHVSSAHPVQDARIFHRELRTLTAAGYETVLVIPHDRDEVIDGVRIRALPRPRSRFERFTRGGVAALRVLREERPAVCHLHDPDLIPLGSMLAASGVRVFYDAHEDLPVQIGTKYWIPRRVQPGVALAARVSLGGFARVVDAIVAATPQVAETFPADRTVVVQNFPWLDELGDGHTRPYAERPNALVYVGAISEGRGILQVVDAIAMLPPALGARLRLVGSFNEPGLEERARARPGWASVEPLGWVGRDRVAAELASARVGVVTLLPQKNYVDAWPVKLFEYMAAGVPAVVSDFPLWRRIVEEAGCGIVVDPTRPEAVAEAMRHLLENPEEAARMGRAGRAAAEAEYHWERQGERLLRLYERFAPLG